MVLASGTDGDCGRLSRDACSVLVLGNRTALDPSATAGPVSRPSRLDAIRFAGYRVVGDGGSKDGRGYEKYHG